MCDGRLAPHGTWHNGTRQGGPTTKHAALTEGLRCVVFTITILIFGLLDCDLFQSGGMWIPRFGTIRRLLLTGGGMSLKDVTILKSAVIQNWHVSCYPQTLGSAVRKILKCQLVPPSAYEYGHHLTQLVHWLLVPEPTLRPTTEMIMAHVAVAEMCQKLTLNLGRVPVVDEKMRPWSSTRHLTCCEMAAHGVNAVLETAFTGLMRGRPCVVIQCG